MLRMSKRFNDFKIFCVTGRQISYALKQHHRKQASQIQKVSAQLEVSRRAQQTVVNNQ